MAPHVRGSLFFLSLVLTPPVFAVAAKLGGRPVAALIAAALVAGGLLVMHLGGSGPPPTGPASP